MVKRSEEYLWFSAGGHMDGKKVKQQELQAKENQDREISEWEKMGVFPNYDG
jgi:hypothetical protein